MKIFFCIIVTYSVVITGCKKNVDYFNGKINIVEAFGEKYEAEGKEVALHDIYTGYMSVYDSLIIFDHVYSNYHLHIFNVNTGDTLGSFCPIGRGPGEWPGHIHAEQYVGDKDIKLWVGDDDKHVFLFNITPALAQRKDCLDSVLFVDARKNSYYPFCFTFIVDSGCFLSKTQCQELYANDKEYVPGSYTLYHKSVDSVVKKYTIYNRLIINKYRKIFPALFYESQDRIKPDGSKVAMGMRRLAQINILDVESGRLEGYRLEGTPDFDYLTEDPAEFKNYYTDVYVDDQYIYALFIIPSEKANREELPHTALHVWSWEGKPLYDIKLDHPISNMAIDPVHNILYGKNEMEEIYKYDLNKYIDYRK